MGRVILGLDPGLERVGYGVIEVIEEGVGYGRLGYGVIRTDRGLGLGERLRGIYGGVGGVIDEYGPSEVAIESLFFGKNVKTGVVVGMARGVLLLICEEKGKRVYEYGPLEVKRAVTGYGRASKGQVMRGIELLLGGGEWDDACDALGVAVCHGNYFQGKKNMEEKY